MRNLLGMDTPVVCGYCGRAPLSTGTAARLCASKPARALHTGPSGTLHTGGAWCPVGEPQLCPAFGTKFSLLSFLAVTTVQNSPCMQIKRQIGPFRACRESFVPEVGPCGSCWESFVPHMRWEGVCWESFVPEVGRPWVLLLGFPAHGHWGRTFRTRRCAPRRWPAGVLHYTKPSTGVSPACRTLL